MPQRFFTALVVVFAASFLGCGDASALCAGLRPGDPVPSVEQESSLAGAFELSASTDGPESYGCCYRCAQSGSGACNCGVDCADPAWQATPIRLGGAYAGECNPSSTIESSQSCVVWAQDNEIKAITSYCLD